jgi:dihydrofolate reductase
MLIRTHVGVSLDGFVANPDGLPAWDALPTYGQGTHGNAELAEQCGAIVMGRSTFDQGFPVWITDWPWPDSPVYVLTSRTLPASVPPGVIASVGGPAGLVEQIRGSGLTRDVHLLGGPRTIQAFLEIGALDRLGICVLPVLLEAGIPLFPIEVTAFSPAAWEASSAAPPAVASRPLLQLDHHRTFPDGAVELVYRTRD